MGICRSSTYWYWTMSTTRSEEALTDQIFDQEEEEWKLLEKGLLKKTCSARVCMTCHYFNYFSDRHCRTILSCHVHRRLIPHGDHLISRCHLWVRQHERGIGWCPEVAWNSDLINRLLWVTMPFLIPLLFYWLVVFLYWFWDLSCLLNIKFFLMSKYFRFIIIIFSVSL